MRVRSWVLASLAIWLTACAAPANLERRPRRPLGGGRPLLASLNGVPRDDAPDPEAKPSGPVLGQATPRQREAEGRLAIRQMWGVLTPIREVGAQVEFTYWVDQGALTMVSWKHTGGSGASGSDADARAFALEFQSLPTLVQGRPRFLRITARREVGMWRSVLHFEPSLNGPPPPEAKTLPVDAPEIAAGPFRDLEHLAARHWLPLLLVPHDGDASLELTVTFEDERLVGSTTGRYEAQGRGVLVEALPGFETEVAHGLIPFTQGLGRHSVHFVLRATRVPGDARPRWWVEQAATLLPEKIEQSESFTTAADYLRFHEELIRCWREQTAQAAMLAVSFTAEQLAVWIVGGWVAHGVGAVLEVAAGPVLRVLGRGGAESAEWLYCLLRRVPDADREVLAELWAKAETRGLAALDATEQSRLRSIFQRLEQLAETPLTPTDKKVFRRIAGERLWPHLQQLDPALAASLIEDGERYPVHHRYGLEYAHFFPEVDINALSNLEAVAPEVHKSINRIWTAFRTSGTEVSPTTIQEVVAIVDQNYGRWYNTAFRNAQHSIRLQAAERAAMTELRAMLAR